MQSIYIAKPNVGRIGNSLQVGTDEFIKQEFQGLKTFNLNSTSISTPQLLNSSIDVSTLKKGIYLIKIKTSEEVIIDKLIKN